MAAYVPIWMRMLRWYALRAPFKRGVYRLAATLYRILPVPDIEVEAIVDQSIKMSVRLSMWVDYNIYCLGVYEEPLVRTFTRLIRENSIVMDVGSYIGQYALLAAKYAPKGKVFALEPHPESFERLRRNIFRNKMENIFALRKAAGREAGFLPFEISAQHSQSGLLPNQGPITDQVEVMPLKEVVERYSLEWIDLVKVDVEGAEGEVLRGADTILERFRPVVIVEMDRYREKVWGDSPELLCSMLGELGYLLYRLEGWQYKPIANDTWDYANIVAIPKEKEEVQALLFGS